MNLAKLTAAPDVTTIPGRILSPPSTAQIATAEMAAARHAMRMIEAYGGDSPTPRQLRAQEVMYAETARGIQRGCFGHDQVDFANWALCTIDGNLTLTLLCLQRKDPNVKMDDVNRIYAEHPNPGAVLNSVLALWGWDAPSLTPDGKKKDDSGDTKEPSPSPNPTQSFQSP